MGNLYEAKTGSQIKHKVEKSYLLFLTQASKKPHKEVQR